MSWKNTAGSINHRYILYNLMYNLIKKVKNVQFIYTILICFFQLLEGKSLTFIEGPC